MSMTTKSVYDNFKSQLADGMLYLNHCVVHNFPLYFSVFSDAERSDCATKEDPSVNYIRNSSRRVQMNDQTFAAGFLRISENETMPSPTRLFHWDTYTMYGKDQEHEFPVYLLDINGFGVNTFVQIETTAPLPTRRRSKKRSQKKASERRLSKQTMISDGQVSVKLFALHGEIEGGFPAVKGGVFPLSLVTHVLVAKRARGSHLNRTRLNELGMVNNKMWSPIDDMCMQIQATFSLNGTTSDRKFCILRSRLNCSD